VRPVPVGSDVLNCWRHRAEHDLHLSAQQIGGSPPDKSQSEGAKSARIKTYACDGGNFTMTEDESSDHVDCTYYGKIVGVQISGAFYCPIRVGGSPIGEFHFEFKRDD
jgi:hypothetical protein